MKRKTFHKCQAVEDFLFQKSHAYFRRLDDTRAVVGKSTGFYRDIEAHIPNNEA